ncbi:DUF397 domain-containing protein, partial [Nocardia cyriacigeorgica]|uniref:DUF397 domain-containing protein n=1 Tax=Nocardia cyriacigeorgica TaxID=135487 RepID=UPI003D7A70ED
RHSDASKECVEVAFVDGGLVGVRDSKNPTGSTAAGAPRPAGAGRGGAAATAPTPRWRNSSSAWTRSRNSSTCSAR